MDDTLYHCCWLYYLSHSLMISMNTIGLTRRWINNKSGGKESYGDFHRFLQVLAPHLTPSLILRCTLPQKPPRVTDGVRCVLALGA